MKRLLLLPLLWLGLTADAGAESRLFIDTSLNPADPYVQAQVRYRVRLYRRSALDTGDFVTPHIPQVLVLGVAEDEPVEVERDGVRWQMIERRYLLFPQRSGSLQLPPEVFSGRQVFAQGKSAILHVQPAAEAHWPWLPAARLTLKQHIEWPKEGIYAGDQVRRTVILEADGLTGAQLPVLELPVIEGMATQRYRVEVDERIEDFGVIGRRIEHYRHIPRQAGRYRLPGIEIRWWDTRADATRIATLPAVELDVLPATGDQRSPSQPSDIPHSTATKDSDGERIVLLWIPAVILLLLLAVFLFRRRFPAIQHSFKYKRLSRRFHQACRHNDPQATAQILSEWARMEWGMPLKPGEIAERLDDPHAASLLWTLDRVLYAGPEHDWNGGSLLEHPPLRFKQKRKTERPQPLPPLNP